MFVKKSGKYRTDRIRRTQKTEKSSSGFTEEKGRVHHTVRTAYKEFQKLQISFEKRKSQLESIQEQLQNQLKEPVLTWIYEESTRQRIKN